MITFAAVPTANVVMLNVCLNFPLAIDTVAGAVAAPVALLDRCTTAPAAGAGFVSVTVPVALVPPVTAAADTVRATVAAGPVSVSVPVALAA